LELEVVVGAILVVLSQGCKWRAINQPNANWNSIYQYFRRWCRQGVWAQAFAQLGPVVRGTVRYLDSTHIKVHRCAANPPGGQGVQAMGRTRGGLNTKLHALVDARGRPLSLVLSAGQEADISYAQTVVRAQPAAWVVADKAYDSDPFRQWLAARGTQACIPPRAKRKHPARFSRKRYRGRHRVENFFERLKNFRRIATRYDKLAETFFGFVCLAATLVSLLW
jgi:transposase